LLARVLLGNAGWIGVLTSIIVSLTSRRALSAQMEWGVVGQLSFIRPLFVTLGKNLSRAKDQFFKMTSIFQEESSR
jgi:ABC-type branched-subunit amino acid transport system permease subunit